MLFMRLLNIRTWNSRSHDPIIRKHLCMHQAQLVLLDSEAIASSVLAGGEGNEGLSLEEVLFPTPRIRVNSRFQSLVCKLLKQGSSIIWIPRKELMKL